MAQLTSIQLRLDELNGRRYNLPEKNWHQMMFVKVLVKILIFSDWLQGLTFGLSESDKVHEDDR